MVITIIEIIIIFWIMLLRLLNILFEIKRFVSTYLLDYSNSIYFNFKINFIFLHFLLIY